MTRRKADPGLWPLLLALWLPPAAAAPANPAAPGLPTAGQPGQEAPAPALPRPSALRPTATAARRRDEEA
jgi:hypothetical protein